MAGHAMHETNAAAWSAMRAAQAAERKARKDARRAANRASWWARYGMPAPEPVDADAVADAAPETAADPVDPTPEPFELEAVEAPGDYECFDLLEAAPVDYLRGFTVTWPQEREWAGCVKRFSKSGLAWDVWLHDGDSRVDLCTPDGRCIECAGELEAAALILEDYDAAATTDGARFERGMTFVDAFGQVGTIVGVGKTIKYTYGRWDAAKQKRKDYSATTRYGERGECFNARGAGWIFADACNFDAADAA